MRRGPDATGVAEVIPLSRDGAPASAHRARRVDALFAEALRRGAWTLDTVSRGLVEAMSECVEILDPQGNRRFMNPAALRLLSDEDAGAGIPWTVSWPFEVRSIVAAAMAAAVTSGSVRFDQLRPTARGGTGRLEGALSPMLDDQRVLLSLVVVSRCVDRQAHSAKIV